MTDLCYTSLMLLILLRLRAAVNQELHHLCCNTDTLWLNNVPPVC